MCPRCGYVVYRNPVPVALVLVEKDDALLMVHRVNAPLAGYWAPPAGYVEMDESLEEGAQREVKEETGLDVDVDELLAVYSRAGTGIMFVTFTAHVTGGALASQVDEVDEVRFFPRNEIPVLLPPENGTVLDNWFYEVLKRIMAKEPISQ